MGVRDSVSIGQEVEPRHPQDVASANLVEALAARCGQSWPRSLSRGTPYCIRPRSVDGPAPQRSGRENFLPCPPPRRPRIQEPQGANRGGDFIRRPVPSAAMVEWPSPKGVFTSVTRRRAREALTDAQQRLRRNAESCERAPAARLP